MKPRKCSNTREVFLYQNYGATTVVKNNISAFHEQRTPEDCAFFTFQPRPNRPELFDEQSAFIDNQDTGVAFHVGGNGAGTSIAAACKIARLILTRQEAPRYDTSFWICGPDYEQTIESMWKEKLYGQGFIMDCEINWDRVTWHDKRRALPSTIPLKPWVNGDKRKNWVLEFRSFAQGRMAMQARSIGGFCLTEQFPWEILVEILRGMRQHNIPGSKFCEFTPIDPSLSAPLKEMMENNTLPKGWAVYRANTLCNVLDPNSPVDKEWYDEFFGMVGDELLETRRTGAWASYEGLIYKSLNSRVHFVDNAPIPRNCVHKRGVDWGGGPYNAFCFDPETEILTNEGWIPFPKYDSQLVGTVNPVTKELEFQQPTGKIARHYEGIMHQCEPKREGANFCVTDHHRMVIEDRRSNKWSFKEVQDIARNDNGYVPRKYEHVSRTPDSNDLFEIPRTWRSRQLPLITKVALSRFIGLWIAEGDYYKSKGGTCLRISNKDQLDDVSRILRDTGWKWNSYVNKITGVTVFSMSSQSIVELFRSADMLHKSHDKKIPRFIMSWSVECLQALLEGLMLGDGSKTHFDSIRNIRCHSEMYHTSSRQLADDVAELAALLGRPTNTSSSIVNTTKSKNLTMYCVRLVNCDGARWCKLPLSQKRYSGLVYCVEVPNGTLVVRRGGKTMVCGNCVLWGAKDDKGNFLIYDEYYTTESVTWEERIRAIHEKDGWSLVMDHPGPPASYRLEPHPEVPVRWRYDMSTFGPTYAPPDDPGAFRECRHYCLPVVQGKTGLSNSYHPSIECIQAMLRYTPEEFKAGTAPLLKIDRARCPNLAREMQILRWQVPPSHATNPRAPKPLQIKDQDHAPDALRALIYSDWIDMQSGVAGHRVDVRSRPQIRHHRGR